MKNNRHGKLKVISFISLFILMIMGINRFIFKKADRKRGGDGLSEVYYPWRHGNIRYITAGSGKPLLLVHAAGIGCGLHEWQKSIKALSKHYRVYALDLLGYGLSDKPDITYTAYLYTSLINDFIRDVIGAPVNVIANGSGAAFSVSAYTLNKSQFVKMMLIAPTGIGPRPVSGRDIWLSKVLMLPVLGTAVFNFMHAMFRVERFLEKEAFDDPGFVTNAMIDQFYILSHAGGACARFADSAYYGGFMEVDIRNQLEHLEVPMHLIWGKNNNLNPAALTDAVQKLVPESDCSIFEETKCFPHWENPKAFYKICRQFFS